MTEAMAIVYGVALDRVDRRVKPSIDNEKLARVADCMDQFLREENERLYKLVEELSGQVSAVQLVNDRLVDRVVELEDNLVLVMDANERLAERNVVLEERILDETESDSDGEPLPVRRRLFP